MLANRGHAVLRLNFRGSTTYARGVRWASLMGSRKT